MFPPILWFVRGGSTHAREECLLLRLSFPCYLWQHSSAAVVQLAQIVSSALRAASHVTRAPPDRRWGASQRCTVKHDVPAIIPTYLSKWRSPQRFCLFMLFSVFCLFVLESGIWNLESGINAGFLDFVFIISGTNTRGGTIFFFYDILHRRNRPQRSKGASLCTPPSSFIRHSHKVQSSLHVCLLSAPNCLSSSEPRSAGTRVCSVVIWFNKVQRKIGSAVQYQHLLCPLKDKGARCNLHLVAFFFFNTYVQLGSCCWVNRGLGP